MAHMRLLAPSCLTIFKECPNPDENQRKQLSWELGLEPHQVKFWFQNKRSQTRTQHERADNASLRADNERICCENLAIQEALKSVICSNCGGSIFRSEESEEQKQHNLNRLKLENALLKDKHGRVAGFLSEVGRSASQILASSNRPGQPLDLVGGCPTQMGNSSHDLDEFSPGPSGKRISDLEKSLMAETAAGAMDELIRLLRINEPLWIKSPTSGKYVLHRESYENFFRKASHIGRTTAREESSKDDCLVAVKGKQLVQIFVDPNKWVDLFPTIVMKASTIHVLSTGILENNDSSLQLLDVQMHSLSPLVAPRPFYLLRYCLQIELGKWVIADVSYECSRESQHITPSRCWRLPSGCLIEDLPGGCSKVTWVEHVEVDDKSQTHRLYGDLVSSGAVYGAERWTVTLQRMCERFTYSSEESTSLNESGRVLTSLDGKRGMKNLAHRMVKSFCAMLNMSGKTDFPHLYGTSNSGVQVSVRKNMELGQPCGMIVSAATSLWLPLPPVDVFNFFTDERTRLQWDTLSNEYTVHAITRVGNGTHPGNSISVFQPCIQEEDQMLILQETCIDQLGALLVYAAVDVSSINIALSGKDTSNIPILPSGLIISGDGHSDIGSMGASSSIYPTGSSGGNSLLTVAFQILVSSGPSASNQVDMASVSAITTLISSTIQRIKVALNCADLD